MGMRQAACLKHTPYAWTTCHDTVMSLSHSLVIGVHSPSTAALATAPVAHGHMGHALGPVRKQEPPFTHGRAHDTLQMDSLRCACARQGNLDLSTEAARQLLPMLTMEGEEQMAEEKRSRPPEKKFP